MQLPARYLYAFRPTAHPGVVATAAAVAILFAATPFALPEVADRFGVSIGAAGLLSTFQVGAFATATLVAGRWLPPSPAAVRWVALAGVAANLLSAVVPAYAGLVLLRAVAGASAGVFTWVAWADAMHTEGSMRTVAAIGPITVLIVSPVLGWVASVGGDPALWIVLGVAALPAAFVRAPVVDATDSGWQRSPSRSNRVLIVALGVLTLAGSSLFVFAATFGQSFVDLTAVETSIGYSLNAGAGLLATRLTARPRTGGPWFALCGLSALALVFVPSPAVFYVSMAVWGFAFWMGLPAAFRALAARSLTPAERIGDAQSLMAYGRALGPFVGGLLVGDGRFKALALFAGLGLLASAGTIGAIDAYRSTHPVQYGPESES